MASRNQKHIRAAKRAATVSVATATVSALMIGTAPLPMANAGAQPAGSARTVVSGEAVAMAALVNALALTLSSNMIANGQPAALSATADSPGLPPMALAPGAPDPASIPDLSFGLGPRAYDAFQSLGAALESGILNNVNLSGLLQYLGYDPEAAINAALGNLLVQALTGVAVPVGSVPVLGPVLNSAGINNVAALLDLLGFNLADPLNLSGAAAPGLNLITAGPPFSLLKFLGADLGWVPGFPNSVADEINGTPYLGISPLETLETLKDAPGVTDLQKTVILDPLILTVTGLLGDADALDVRVPVVLGFGLGAFAAGMAYPQVVEQLPFQPGGAQYDGDSPLAGSLTILPMILLRNPGRANGGLFARFYPAAGLLGIDTITPDTEVSSSVGSGGLNIPVGNTGIVLGGANLIPIKVDGTVEYDPLSDVPAWPNPVSLANSAAALFFPTYILRGVTAASLTEVVEGQLNPQLAAALANTTGPLALNLYLTVPVNGALPLLEPVRLPIDVINLFTGANLNNPIATALEPALTTLVNLGYTDVERTVVNGVPVYDRTLDQANVITPFGTLPSGVNWGQVPGDLLLQLGSGIGQAVDQGLISDTPVVNPLAVLANVLGLDGLPGAADAMSPLSGVTDLSGLTDSAVNAAASAAIPAAVPAQSPAPSAEAISAARTVAPPQDPAPSATNALADKITDADPAPVAGAGPVLDDGTTPAKPDKPANATTRVKSRVDASVQRGANSVKKVVKGVQDGLRNTVRAVTGAGKPAQKPADTDKPADRTDKTGDSDSG
jgi:hypothetical protein